MGMIYRIGDMLPSRRMKDNFHRINLQSYLRVKPGMIDSPREQVIEKAMHFRYLDADTNLPSLEYKRRDKYMTNLTLLWALPKVRIDLEASYWTGKKFAEFSLYDYPYGAINVKTGEMPLEREDKVVKWEGFLETNNFWPLFSPQFDDSAQRIEGLYVNPFGVFVIKYADLLQVDEPISIQSLYLFGIIQNIKTIDYMLH